LHVASDELLRVLLQDRVDLVEEVVDVLGDLRVPLGDPGSTSGATSSTSSSRRALPDWD
jgi:hypothetical protein